MLTGHADDDTSAWSGKKSRPGYAALLDELDSVDVVIAWAPDRLTHRTKELVELIDALETAGVDVLTVQGGRVDLATAGERMAAKLAGVLAEHEPGLKSERNKPRHATIAAEGWPNGGRTVALGPMDSSRIELPTAAPRWT